MGRRSEVTDLAGWQADHPECPWCGCRRSLLVAPGEAKARRCRECGERFGVLEATDPVVIHS